MSTERFRELDGLRGIASVASHFTVSYDLVYPGAPPSPILAPWGAFGVQLFFMISGFVILMTARRARRPSDFVISRLSRLYPAYWISLTLAIALAVTFQIPHHQISWWDRLWNYTMVQRWFLVPNQDDVYWTLAVEMQFYLLIFLLLLVTRSRLSDRVVTVAAGAWMAVGLVVALWAGPASRGIDPQLVATQYKLVLNVTLAEWAPLFSAGMFAFLARKEPRFRWPALAAGLLAIAEGAILHDWGYALADLIVVVIFMAVAFRQHTRFLLLAPIQFYGRISYSLYITHNLAGLVIMHLVMPYLGRVGAMLFAFAAVTVIAWAVHELGEVRLSRAAKTALQRLQRPVPQKAA